MPSLAHLQWGTEKPVAPSDCRFDPARYKQTKAPAFVSPETIGLDGLGGLDEVSDEWMTWSRDGSSVIFSMGNGWRDSTNLCNVPFKRHSGVAVFLGVALPEFFVIDI